MDQARQSTLTPPPLTGTEERAWFGVMTLVAMGLPEIERTIREQGLVYFEYLLLAELAAAPDGHRMSALAGCLRASPSRLSHRIRKLVELGYVTQQPDPSDRRVTIAVITDRGRRVVDELTPAHRRDLRRLVFDPLAPAQVAALADAMTAIAHHLKENARPEPDGE
jgi:DNA-binding MarR family transcriptional regulator